MSRRFGLARALILPVMGAAIMIAAAYDPPWNGADLIGWALFFFGVLRFGRA